MPPQRRTRVCGHPGDWNTRIKSGSVLSWALGKNLLLALGEFELECPSPLPGSGSVLSCPSETSALTWQATSQDWSAHLLPGKESIVWKPSLISSICPLTVHPRSGPYLVTVQSKEALSCCYVQWTFGALHHHAYSTDIPQKARVSLCTASAGV